MQPIQGFCQVVTNPVRISLPSTCAGVKIYVASTNDLKKNAALQAIQNVFNSKVKHEVQGHPASSEVKAQPHGIKMTIEGAKNRMHHLHYQICVQDSTDSTTAKDNIARFYLSFENGVIEESFTDIEHEHVFRKHIQDEVWVDRCYIICQIFYNSKQMTVEGFSDGVPVPYEAVEESEKTGWNKIAGEFIAEQYQTDPKNWHKVFSGVSRDDLMQRKLESLLADTVKVFI